MSHPTEDLQHLDARRRCADPADGYNAEDDFAKSINEAYRVIRARVAAGGKGWTPP